LLVVTGSVASGANLTELTRLIGCAMLTAELLSTRIQPSRTFVGSNSLQLRASHRLKDGQAQVVSPREEYAILYLLPVEFCDRRA
jgi:hypothetical protein